MSRSRVQISETAADDILQQFEWYKQQSGARLVARWENALSSALLRITHHPHSGTLCNFKSSELAGTRRMSIANFPKHLIFTKFIVMAS